MGLGQVRRREIKNTNKNKAEGETPCAGGSLKEVSQTSPTKDKVEKQQK